MTVLHQAVCLDTNVQVDISTRTPHFQLSPLTAGLQFIDRLVRKYLWLGSNFLISGSLQLLLSSLLYAVSTAQFPQHTGGALIFVSVIDFDIVNISRTDKIQIEFAVQGNYYLD